MTMHSQKASIESSHEPNITRCANDTEASNTKDKQNDNV